MLYNFILTSLLAGKLLYGMPMKWKIALYYNKLKLTEASASVLDWWGARLANWLTSPRPYTIFVHCRLKFIGLNCNLS